MRRSPARRSRIEGEEWARLRRSGRGVRRDDRRRERGCRAADGGRRAHNQRLRQEYGRAPRLGAAAGHPGREPSRPPSVSGGASRKQQLRSIPGCFVAAVRGFRVGRMEILEAPGATGVRRGIPRQPIDFPGRVVAFSSVPFTPTLEVRPHRRDQVAAFQDQLVAQVEAEEIDDDRAAPAPMAPRARAARRGSRRSRSDPSARASPAPTGFTRNGRSDLVETPHVIAGSSTLCGDRKVGLLVVLVAGPARRRDSSGSRGTSHA